MKGALSSTVYRELPFIGGQPLPHAIPMGFVGSRYLSARARAVEPSEASCEVKFRRCISVF